jgi:peptidoglycan hydrolase-like protein with peptidoglycan-binding domain
MHQKSSIVPGVINMKAMKHLIAFGLLVSLLFVVLNGCSSSIPSSTDPVTVPTQNEPSSNPTVPSETYPSVKPTEPTEKPVEPTVPTVPTTPEPTVPAEEVPPAPEVPEPPVTYSAGSHGQVVKDIQNRLTVFGYKISVDGDFGLITQWAVRDFQARNSIPVTGTVDTATLDALSLEPTDSTRFLGPSSDIPLAKGAKGDEVLELQVYLNRFNYRLALDGIFGSATSWALKDFQKRNGIPVTGIADGATYQKLALEPTSKTRYSGPPAATSISASKAEAFVNNKGLSSPSEYLIWVSTPTTHLYIFKGSAGNWELLKDMRCTVGKPSTPTIKGTFSVIGKGGYFTVPDHEEWICRYYTQFYGDFLIHSVVYDWDLKLVDGRLGMYLSKGCVRVSLANAKYIYDNMPYGTTVYVN